MTGLALGFRRLGAILAAILFLPSVAIAQLTPIETELFTRCLGIGGLQANQGYQSDGCTESGSISNTDVQASASATISVGTGPGLGSPFASASGSSSADFQGGNIVVQGSSGPGSGHAQLTYQVNVIPLQPAPVSITSLPVNVFAQATVDTTHTGSGGGSTATASFTLRRSIVPFPPLFEEEVTAVSPPFLPFLPSDGFVVNNIFNYQLGTIYEVELFAEAKVSATAGFGGQLTSVSTASAFVDPVFSFDQTSFDDFASQQGFTTFPLDQYFAFEFSVVPEPCGLPWLAVIGLVSRRPLRSRSLLPMDRC